MAVQLRDLVDLPDSPADRCRLAERFLDEWLPDFARTDRDIPADVPAALGWAYGRCVRLFAQDPLVGHHEVVASDADVIPFRREQQGVVEWGYRADGTDDPEVLVRPGGDETAVWQPYQDSLSMHLLEGVLTETTLEGTYAADVSASDDVLDSLRALPTLGIPRHPFWGGAGSVEWHGMEGVVVRNDADTWLWAVARSQTELDALVEAVPADWTFPDPQNS